MKDFFSSFNGKPKAAACDEKENIVAFGLPLNEEDPPNIRPINDHRAEVACDFVGGVIYSVSPALLS